MNFFKRNIIKIALLPYLFMIPIVSFSACDPGKQICNPIKQDTIAGLVKTLLEGVIKIGIPIIALAIIYCGFLFVEARGNPESIKKAKESLLYTIIGAAILLGSWAIAILIANTVSGLG